MPLIPFAQNHTTGMEFAYIEDAIRRGALAGDGAYARKCQAFFEERFGFRKCLMTSSCTDALEMAAVLIGIQPGDEVIMPAYTFVSTANAFVLRGGVPVFCDSRPDHPNMDESLIEGLITERTKAIVVVHYAGMACKMDAIMDIAMRHGLVVVEDAAQAVGSFFIDDAGARHPLGGIGHLGTLSFDGQKNISCGEGGMLVINAEEWVGRAEIVWQKGTNRAAFFRGEVDKYSWVDVGSNFALSELNAAYLFAQLEHMEAILQARVAVCTAYRELIESLGTPLQAPEVPDWGTNNGHIFYLVCSSLAERAAYLSALKEQGVGASFHYQSLNGAVMGGSDARSTPHAMRYSDCLFRLPVYPGIDVEDVAERLQTAFAKARGAT